MKFRFVTTIYSEIADNELLVWESVEPVEETQVGCFSTKPALHLQVRIFRDDFWRGDSRTMCFTALQPCSRKFAGASAKSQA